MPTLELLPGKLETMRAALLLAGWQRHKTGQWYLYAQSGHESSLYGLYDTWTAYDHLRGRIQPPETDPEPAWRWRNIPTLQHPLQNYGTLARTYTLSSPVAPTGDVDLTPYFYPAVPLDT